MARMLYLRDIEVDVHVRCRACGHEGVLPRADMQRRFGPNYPVLSIAPHYRCSRCDSRDTESRPAPPPVLRPAWAEAAEDPPSFAGPLAALQGLLDAVRGRDGDEDGGQHRDPEDADDAPCGSPAGSAAPAVPPAPESHGRPLPSLRLEDLIADTTPPDAAGRRPLWEPVSLADMAAHPPPEDEPEEDDADQDDADEGGLPADRRTAGEERSREDEDDPAAHFERTIAALRGMLGNDGAPRPKAGRAAPDTGRDHDPDDDAPPPAFSVQALVRTDFEDDEDDQDEDDQDRNRGNEIHRNEIHRNSARRAPWIEGGIGREDEGEAAEKDPWEEDLPEEEPSDEDILAFAIRDPEKAPPRREPAADPDEPPLDRTIATLSDLVRQAADSGDEKDDDGDRAGWSRGRDDDAVVRPFPFRRPPVTAEEDEEDQGDEDRDEDPPASRKSAQELDMEEALRALRALVEQEDVDEDEPLPPMPPTPIPLRAARPARAEWAEREPDPELEEDGAGEPDTAPGSDEESAPMADPVAGKGAPSSLDKTIAALRSMLELDGKRGR